MIKEQLDSLIKKSMLAKNHIRTIVLRDIKTKFMEWETAKSATPLNEQTVIRKMIEARETAANIFNKAGRNDLASKEIDEARCLAEFLEAGVDEATTIAMVKEALDNSCTNIGAVMKYVKQHLPNVDMKFASSLARELLALQ